MMSKSLLGHERVWHQLCAALERDHLPHALLFTGPPGIGKALTALRFAARVACCGRAAPCGECNSCRQVAAGTHPDLAQISLPAGKKEIGIDLARQLKRFVHMRAVAAPRKMAIVDNAERLSVAAQNALLKTLEEPPGRSLVMLVATSPGALLPTVRSRCQRIVFQPLSQEHVCAVLQQAGIDASAAEELARQAAGSPGRALLLREIWRQSDREQLEGLLAEVSTSRYISVVSMSRALGRTEKEMESRLEALLDFCHAEVVRNASGEPRPGGDRAAGGGIYTLDLDVAVRSADIVAETIRTLRRRNPNRPLLAEALALRLARA